MPRPAGLPLLLLLVLALLALAASARPPKERAWGAAAVPAGPHGAKAAASWDEVNLLAHAVLQLGHGLKEHVDRTREQLRDLRARLGAHEDALGRAGAPPPEPEPEQAARGSPEGGTTGNSSGAPADLAALQVRPRRVASARAGGKALGTRSEAPLVGRTSRSSPCNA